MSNRVEFTQSEASDVWVVNHNLNKYVSVEVLIEHSPGVFKVMLPKSVKLVNLNTVNIEFSAPTSGKAVIC